MLITYIKLQGYKRMPLRESEDFEYYFTSKLVMIVGVNGSGKSSLINELTPLPANKDNFNKNGYKEIHIQKDNTLYKLISDFTNGSHFSFLANDVELNASANISTQRDLVFQHFLLTPNIHEILIGRETFTGMSLLSRKKLFNSITHLNIDSILSNYNTLKEELKNNEYSLKSQLQLYTVEEQRLANPTHQEHLKDKLKEIKEYMDTLLDVRSSIFKHIEPINLESTYSNLKTLETRFKSLSDKYYTQLTSYSSRSIPMYFTECNHSKSILEYKLSSNYSLLESKQEQLKILEINKQHNISTLSSQRDITIITIDKIQSSLSILPKNTRDVMPIKTNLYKLEASLPEILRSISTNQDKQYTKDKYNSTLTLKKESLDKISSLLQLEGQLQKELEHTLSHKDNNIKCPNCSHEWSLIYSTEKVKSIENKLSTLQTDKYNLQQNIIQLDKIIEEITTYFTYYRQYTTLKSYTQEYLQPLWDTIDNTGYIFSNPTAILSILKTFNNELMALDEVITLEATLKDINKNIQALNDLKGTDISTVLKEIEELNIEVYELLLQKDDIDTHLHNLNVTQKVYEALQGISNSINKCREDVFTTNLSLSLQTVIDNIDDELRTAKIVLIEIDKELNTYDNIKYTLSKYDLSMNDIKENIKILSMILDELSPKNGIIAKSVSSFLNVIINGINSVLDSVWEYKMNLSVIDVEDDALNYKFKLVVEDKLEVSDISLASAGMRKAINISFVFMMYKLLGLQGYPLFLDEFTTNLDKVHKEKLERLLNDVSKTDRFSQIFFISHDRDYIFMKDLEVLELS